MKAFLIRVGLFTLLINIIILALPIDERIQLSQQDSDCLDRAIWIHDRTVVNKGSIDIAFLGSSRTLNAINDKYLSESHHESFQFTNFAYCRFGNNLSLTILKRLLKYKNPKYIILEVRAEESRYSHPLFPIYGGRNDLLSASLCFNKDYFTDFLRHQKMRLNIFIKTILKNEPITYKMELYGFHNENENQHLLSTRAAQRELENTKFSKNESGISDWFHNLYPKSYIERIHLLCEENNTELLFLYLPQYGMPLEKPKKSAYYEKFGEIIYLPAEINSDFSLWADENHLNRLGSKKVSEFLLKEF